MTLIKTACCALALGTIVALPAKALLIDDPSFERKASLDSATSGKSGMGNPGAADIQTAFPTDPWTKEGELTSNGANDLLTVSLTSGNWGDDTVAGTWSIAASFWTTYGEGVISMHVGGGKVDGTGQRDDANPEWFAWQITQGETSGTFSLTRKSGGGGGISNLKLWGRGEPQETTTVPDGGASLALLGLGLAAVGAIRRKA